MLTEKQERFCQFAAQGLALTHAYQRAGYSPRGAAQSAHRLAKKPVVQERIRYLRDAIATPAIEQSIREATLDRQWVLTRLKKIVEDSMTETETGAFRNPQAAIRSLELMGKDLGMFVERKEVTNGAPRPFAHMSVEELERYGEELKQEESLLKSMRRMISSAEN